MDHFEGLLAVILMLLHWRVALTFAVSLCFAVALVMTFSWVSGLQGFLMVVLGFFAGAGWESAARRPKAGKPMPPKAPVSRWTLPMLALIVGLTLGLASWTSRGAMVFGGVLLALIYAGWLAHQPGSGKPEWGLRWTLLSAVAGFVSYAVTLVFTLSSWQN